MMLVVCIRLAFLQLWRERAAACCRVLAMAAILVPLVVLLGLKFGIVSALRDNLLRDPHTLEISIISTPEPFTEADFAELRRRPEVGWLQPDTGSIFTRVGVQAAADEAESKSTPYSLIPTAEGDPVLRAADVAAPADDAAVITHKLAEQLQLHEGDEIRVSAWRNRYQERMQKKFRIAAVLPNRCHASAAVFAPAAFTLEVRRFISAGNGTPGIAADLAKGSYAAVVLPPGSAQEVSRALCAYDAKLQTERVGEGGSPEPGSLVVSNAARRLNPAGAAKLLEIAQGHNCKAYPYNPPVSGWLASTGSKLQISGETAVDGAISECPAPPTLYVAPGCAGTGEDTLCLLSAGGEESRIFCRLRESEGIPAGQALVSPQMLCLLHIAQKYLLLWDYRTGSARYPEQNFFCMRLYANSLENTEPLLRFMEQRGVVCNARLNSIHHVLQLERALDNLFLIICTGAGVGALISFGLSLFNEAELHRRHYATVQLLGAGRGALALIPIVSALAETMAVLCVTFLCFAGLAFLIDFLMMTEDGSLPPCRLALSHVCTFSAVCFATAFVASLAAAGKVLSISPSEILRES